MRHTASKEKHQKPANLRKRKSCPSWSQKQKFIRYILWAGVLPPSMEDDDAMEIDAEVTVTSSKTQSMFSYLLLQIHDTHSTLP